MLKSPVTNTLVTCAGKLELFVQVNTCAGLVKPTANEPKSLLVGLMLGCPPSAVSANSMYSRSFSWGVMEPATHSDGKLFAGELLLPST